MGRRRSGSMRGGCVGARTGAIRSHSTVRTHRHLARWGTAIAELRGPAAGTTSSRPRWPGQSVDAALPAMQQPADSLISAWEWIGGCCRRSRARSTTCSSSSCGRRRHHGRRLAGNPAGQRRARPARGDHRMEAPAGRSHGGGRSRRRRWPMWTATAPSRSRMSPRGLAVRLADAGQRVAAITRGGTRVTMHGGRATFTRMRCRRALGRSG